MEESITEGEILLTNKSPKLSEFFEELEKKQVNAINVVQSITYNEKNRTIIIELGHIMKENIAAKRLKVQRIGPEIRRLSESYGSQFSELQGIFHKWEPCRRTLIEKCETYANNMDRNFSLVSSFRILTALVDIIGSAFQLQSSSSSWANFALENAPVLSLGSLFVEMTGTNRMYSDIKKLIKKDQEKLQKLKLWFKKTEEQDTALRNFFPYGIDDELAREINKTASNSDEYSKLFMTIVATNAQKNAELFKDEEFLGKATYVATSEAGILWFQKAIANPVWRECYNSNLAVDISKISTSVQNPSLVGLDMASLVYRKLQTKMILNAITIYSAGSDLWNNTKSENSATLREVARQLLKEYEAMKEIVRRLKLRPHYLFTRQNDERRNTLPF